MLDNITVPRAAVVRALKDWGYLQSLDVTDEVLSEAIAAYQSFNGLPVDGEVGPRTVHQMTSPLRCGLPDLMLDQSCAWPHRLISYTTRFSLSGLSAEQADQAFDAACQQISAVCGLSFRRVASSTANIVARSGAGQSEQLDGRGGTLGYSYLPCGMGPNGVVQQRYDEAEQWTYSMALAVMTHELCHGVGLPHLSNGSLMAPYYNAAITKPQAADIAELQKRYGPPAPGSPPPVGSSPRVEVAVIINGAKYVAAGEMKLA